MGAEGRGAVVPLQTGPFLALSSLGPSVRDAAPSAAGKTSPPPPPSATTPQPPSAPTPRCARRRSFVHALPPPLSLPPPPSASTPRYPCWRPAAPHRVNTGIRFLAIVSTQIWEFHITVCFRHGSVTPPDGWRRRGQACPQSTLHATAARSPIGAIAASLHRHPDLEVEPASSPSCCH
ncbi:Os10g0165700 [Oryza sativa Japonica Group]|uniref:Os10g0165700 protein n=2 Tax=Oryza TaxID=4527 RepID=A0A0N7KRH5_ORYSJ|nr:Os10g0165700 [Oryza sativa Japonica Group]